jgi:hypothetical protein
LNPIPLQSMETCQECQAPAVAADLGNGGHAHVCAEAVVPCGAPGCKAKLPRREMEAHILAAGHLEELKTAVEMNAMYIHALQR